MGPAPHQDGEPPAPLPVPELHPSAPAAPGATTGAGDVTAAPPRAGASAGVRSRSDGPVTDDDRQRFGVLLDRALERGLLDPVEYQRRLGALAVATTVEELRDLVTELPAFRSGRAAGAPPKRSRPGGLAALGRPRYGATATARRSPWPVLVVVLVVVAVLVVVLAVAASHLARTHRGSAGLRPVPPVVAAARVPGGGPAVLSPSRP